MTKNKWALGFCDCCSYRDEEGKCWCFPTFFPQAVCGTCCIEGEIYSIINDESRCCCRMGSGGLCRCIIQVPIGILGPFGGIPLAICCGAKTRHEVITKYEMSDSSSGTCCGTCIGLLYPCSLFQILMTLREFERKGIKPLPDLKTPIYK